MLEFNWLLNVTCKDISDTVNIVIFAGKISQKCWQDISLGGHFYDTTPISFIKVYGFYFHVG